MSSLIKGSNKSIGIDASNDAARFIFSSRIGTNEILAKIRENVSEQAKGISNNHVNVVLMAKLCNDELIFQWCIRQNNSFELLQLLQVTSQTLGLKLLDGYVGIQLRHSWYCNGGTGFTN